MADAPKAHPPRAGWLCMYYVYIIYSEKVDKFYISYSEDLKERIARHNSGRSNFTSKGSPWVLVHYQGFLVKKDAQEEEKFLKTGKGRERTRYLLKTFIENKKWRDG